MNSGTKQTTSNAVPPSPPSTSDLRRATTKRTKPQKQKANNKNTKHTQIQSSSNKNCKFSSHRHRMWKATNRKIIKFRYELQYYHIPDARSPPIPSSLWGHIWDSEHFREVAAIVGCVYNVKWLCFTCEKLIQ